MLEQIFVDGFGHKVTLYVPGTTDVSETLSAAAANLYVESALRFLSSEFGGATALRADGSWIAQDGTLVVEQTTLVYAFAKELSTAHLRAVKQFALDLKAALRQEAVGVEIDGDFFLV